jgi:hypothetical protein
VLLQPGVREERVACAPERGEPRVERGQLGVERVERALEARARVGVRGARRGEGGEVVDRGAQRGARVAALRGVSG